MVDFYVAPDLYEWVVLETEGPVDDLVAKRRSDGKFQLHQI